MIYKFTPTLKFSMTCVKKAGTRLLHLRRQLSFTRKKMNHHNVVTEADYASEKYIVDEIKTTFPEHGIISEEAGIVDPDPERFWIIDSLDGTSNFAAGLDWFGVMMAYVENNRVQNGVAYLPVSKLLFYAAEEQGARCNLDEISIKQELKLQDALCAFGLDADAPEPLLKKQFKIVQKIATLCRNIRSTNCLLDFLHVAEGKIGGVINFNMRIWDIAALSVIISEAGGVFTDIKGRPIDFTFSSSLPEKEYAVIAGTPQIHRSLLEIVSQYDYPNPD